MSGEHEPREFHIHPEAIDITNEGTYQFGHVHIPDGATPDEARDAIAAAHDSDPDNIQILGSRKDKQRANRAVWGFSSWGGCKWEPTGPQGDPNLN